MTGTYRESGTGWVSSSDEDVAESPGNSAGLLYTIGTRRWAANLDKVINKRDMVSGGEQCQAAAVQDDEVAGSIF